MTKRAGEEQAAVQTTKKVAVAGRPDDATLCAWKLTLQTARRSRAHDAMLFKTYIVKASSAFYVNPSQALKAYNKDTKGKKGHGLGRLEQHVWGVLLQTAVDKLPDGAEKTNIMRQQ